MNVHVKSVQHFAEYIGKLIVINDTLYAQLCVLVVVVVVVRGAVSI